MTPAELDAFISKKMSKSHIYQPAILTVLLENDGKASVRSIAERCNKVTGKPTSEFEKSLQKYPKQALITNGVIKVEQSQFQLTCSDISDELRARLVRATTEAMSKFST